MMNVTEAIRRMRLARQAKQPVGLLFYASTKPYGIRKVENCMLRSRPIDADAEKAGSGSQRKFFLTDRFIYFTDLDTGEAKQCRKRLITKIRIGSTWHEVTLE